MSNHHNMWVSAKGLVITMQNSMLFPHIAGNVYLLQFTVVFYTFWVLLAIPKFLNVMLWLSYFSLYTCILLMLVLFLFLGLTKFCVPCHSTCTYSLDHISR